MNWIQTMLWGISIVILAIVMASGQGSAISACGTLNTENATYTVTENLSSAFTCITVGADNVTLDCAGYAIYYNSAGDDFSYGINVSGHDYTRIINCVIIENTSLGLRAYGIFLEYSSSNTITNTSVSTSSYYTHGIHLEYSSSNTITNTTISTSHDVAYGIFFYSSNNNTITNTSVSTSGVIARGIYFDYISSNNTITNTTISTSGEDAVGIFLYGGNNGTALNTSYSLEFVDSGSELFRKWFVKVNVTDSGSAVSGATVKGFANGNSNTSDGTFTTPASGIATASFTEYKNTSTTTYWTPTRILAYSGNRIAQTMRGVWGNNGTVNLSLGEAISFVSPTPRNTSTINGSDYIYIPVTTTLNFTASNCNIAINGINYALTEQNETNFYAIIVWSGSNGLVTYNVTCMSSLSGGQFMSLTRELTINITRGGSFTPPIIQPPHQSYVQPSGTNELTDWLILLTKFIESWWWFLLLILLMLIVAWKAR